MPRYPQPVQQVGVVAVAEERLRVGADHLRVQVRQHGELVVAADRRHDCADRAVGERRSSGRRPAHCGAADRRVVGYSTGTSPSSSLDELHGELVHGPGTPRAPPRTATRPRPGRPATASAARSAPGASAHPAGAPHARVFTRVVRNPSSGALYRATRGASRHSTRGGAATSRRIASCGELAGPAAAPVRRAAAGHPAPSWCRGTSRSSWTATAAGRTRRGLPRTEGHRAGEAALMDVLHGAIELGIGTISRLRVLDRELAPLTGRGALPDGLQQGRHPPPPRRAGRAGRADPLGRPAAAAVAQRDQPARGRRAAHRAATTGSPCSSASTTAAGPRSSTPSARSPARSRPAGSTRPRSTSGLIARAPRRAGPARRRPVHPHRPASSARPTSCSGSRPTPSWCSSTPRGRTSTAGTCGRRAWPTRSATAASAPQVRSTAGSRDDRCG